MARHGDLRNACVARGLSLLESKGLAAVSLREIAREVGVSPRAPYRHFADKSALLAAIAEEGFIRFAAALASSRPSSRRRASPQRRLQALGAAYIDFAIGHPHLVALMFGDAFPDRARRFPALHRAALAAFALLDDAVQEALDARGQRRRAATVTSLTAISAWALVHGLADLLRHDQLTQVRPGHGARRPRVERADLERFAVRLLLRA